MAAMSALLYTLPWLEMWRENLSMFITPVYCAMAKAFCFSVFTSARSAGCGVLPSFFAWLMRDFAWLISMRFAFTLRFTML